LEKANMPVGVVVEPSSTNHKDTKAFAK